MDLFLKETSKALDEIDFQKLPQKALDKMDLFLEDTSKSTG